MSCKGKREKTDHTFEALVQTPGPLEQLVEVRPAVEHSLEGVVVGKLQQRTSSDKSMLVNFHRLITSSSHSITQLLQIDQLKQPSRLWYLEGALAVVAAEAGLVVDAVVGGELVDEVHRLVAGGALGGRPLEGGRHGRPSSPSATTHSAYREAARGILWCSRAPNSPASLELLLIDGYMGTGNCGVAWCGWWW